MPNRVVYSFIASDRFSSAANRIAKRTEAIRRKFRKLGPSAKFASAQVKAAMASMGRAVKGFMATALLPMVAAFASIAAVMKFFTLGTGFQDAIADLQAITGATGKDLEFLRESALRMGKQTKISSAEVATAFKLVGSAKPELLKNTQALAQVTEQVLLLKNASGLELPIATNTAVKSLNAFGQGADQANRFVNVLAAGAKFGAAEVGDIGESLKNVAPVAKLAGLNFETTNAALQVLALNSQKGAEAGTGLRSSLLKLNKEIPFDQVGGFANALEELASRNLNLNQLQEIFGEEMVKTGSVLVNNVGLLRTLEKQMTGTNVAQEQAAIRMGTLSAKARGLGVTVSNFLIRAFNMLGPQLDGTITKMERFFNTIDPKAVARFSDRLSVVIRGIVALGSIAFRVFSLVSPLITLIFQPIRLLVNLLERLASIPGAVSLLGTFGADAIKDLVGAEAGKLSMETTSSTESSSRIDMEMTINAPKGIVQSTKITTSGQTSGLNVAQNMVESL